MNRPTFLEIDGKTVTQEWTDAYGFIVKTPAGKVVHRYIPTPKQLDFHESIAPNCILEGSRGTGKSVALRNDAHMRAMSYPGFTYLVVRLSMPELKKSHLRWMPQEMRNLGGSFHKTDAIATYPNGSQGFFSHCSDEEEMMKLLSSEYDAIYFDEISTFTWETITKICTCLRVREDSGLLAIVRGGTNPIGAGSAEVRRHYIIKDITPEEDRDYDPDDYQAIHTTLDDNPHIDRVQYIKRLSKLPAHIRRAWLDGEWVVEGAYFHDYKPRKVRVGQDDLPWHVVNEYPVIPSQKGDGTLETPFHWIQFYRAIDWGFSPDPCVCLWIASLPNGRAFVLKERTWLSTTAAQVAKDIKADSEGYRVVDTFCDPTMFFGSEATDYMAIGDIFETNGVPMTRSKNDRAAAGFAIHEYLNTLLPCTCPACENRGKKGEPPLHEPLPKLQIYEPGAPKLVRTLGEVRTDKNHPERIANGNDHYVIALAYFCFGHIGVSRETLEARTPRWMRPKRKEGTRYRLGQNSVSNRTR